LVPRHETGNGGRDMETLWRRAVASGGLQWWVCLFLAPGILVAIELFHPAGFTHEPGMVAYLSSPQDAPHAHGHAALGYFGPQWWFWLHMIQTPMVGLVCVGLWQMIAGYQDVFAWAARIATFVFFVAYTVLDSIGGIGLGRALLTVDELAASGTLTGAELAAVRGFLDRMWVDPWVGGVGSMVSLTGSWAAFAATGLTALSLLWTKWYAGWPTGAGLVWWIPPLAILGYAGWSIQLSHAALTGPIGFGLILVAGVWIWVLNADARRHAE